MLGLLVHSIGRPLGCRKTEGSTETIVVSQLTRKEGVRYSSERTERTDVIDSGGHSFV